MSNPIKLIKNHLKIADEDDYLTPIIYFFFFLNNVDCSIIKINNLLPGRSIFEKQHFYP